MVVTVRVLKLLGAAAVALMVAVAGTMVHRSVPPWGIMVSLALVLSSGVLFRAWAGLLGALAHALVWLVVVQVLALGGGGGDVLIADQPVGYVWMYGGLVMAALPVLAPHRWFADLPLRRQPR